MRLFTIVALFLVAPLLAAADIVYTKDGRQIEGKVIEDNRSEIVLLVERPGVSARMKIKKSSILRIEKKKTRFDVLREKYQGQLATAVKANNIAGWETLATWCRLVGLTTEAKQAIDRALPMRERMATLSNTADDWHALANWCRKWKKSRQAKRFDERAIGVDAQYGAARLALGHKQLDGRWMTPAQYKVAYADKMRRSGYVQHEGKWYSAEGAIAIARLRDARLANDLAATRSRLETAERAVGERNAEIAALKIAYDKLRRQAAFDLQRLERERDAEKRRSIELLRLLRIERAARLAAEAKAKAPK